VTENVGIVSLLGKNELPDLNVLHSRLEMIGCDRKFTLTKLAGPNNVTEEYLQKCEAVLEYVGRENLLGKEELPGFNVFDSIVQKCEAVLEYVGRENLLGKEELPGFNVFDSRVHKCEAVQPTTRSETVLHTQQFLA
jgi:hypothetical protein